MADSKQHKNKEDKQKRPNFFVRIGRWFKGVFSELGKVSWPSAAKVAKKTGIVLAVVSFFLLVIFGFDIVLDLLYKLATKNLKEGTEGAVQLISAITHFGGV